MLNRHNHNYSGGFPIAVGDRYYSQDIFRDFVYLMEKSGLAITDIIGNIPYLVSGGYVTNGTNWDDIDITAAIGYHEYDVTVPDSFASLPPTTTTETLRAIRVESTVQSDFDISGATLDGSTVNYLKMEYQETNGNIRNRAKKAGSYNYEIIDSLLLTADSTPGTSKQVTVATFIGDGSSFLTITNIEPMNIGKIYLDKMYQDDSRNSIIKPAGSKLWELSSTLLVSSENEKPFEIFNFTYVFDSNKLFTDRGVFYNDNGVLVCNCGAWTNEGVINIFIKPDWLYTTGSTHFIFDSRYHTSIGIGSDGFFMSYNETTDTIDFNIFVDGANRIEIKTDPFTTNPSLQKWLAIQIGWTESGNDAKLFLDGVEMDGTTNGTKNVSGSGITGIDLSGHDNIVLGNHGDDPGFNLPAPGWYTGMLIKNVYSSTVDAEYVDPLTAVPYFTDNRIAGVNHTHVLDEFGNMGLSSLAVPDIIGDVEVSGKLIFNARYIPDGNTMFGAQTHNTIFDTLSPFIPVPGDKMIINGGMQTGATGHILADVRRNTLTTMTIRGLTLGGVSSSTVITDGAATPIQITAAW